MIIIIMILLKDMQAVTEILEPRKVREMASNSTTIPHFLGFPRFVFWSCVSILHYSLRCFI